MSQEFRPACELLHQQLLAALKDICEQGVKDLDKLLTAAVFTIEEYLEKLYALIPPDGFTAPDEEIWFFKHMKPLFTAEREFHQRLYHAHVFESDIHFWQREQDRMEKILSEHRDFVHYYHNGETLYDYPWFARGRAPMPTSLCVHPWETNPWHTSAKDSWVGGLIAVERYRDWLKERIARRVANKETDENGAS